MGKWEKDQELISSLPPMNPPRCRIKATPQVTSDLAGQDFIPRSLSDWPMLQQEIHLSLPGQALSLGVDLIRASSQQKSTWWWPSLIRKQESPPTVSPPPRFTVRSRSSLSIQASTESTEAIQRNEIAILLHSCIEVHPRQQHNRIPDQGSGKASTLWSMIWGGIDLRSLRLSQDLVPSDRDATLGENC